MVTTLIERNLSRASGGNVGVLCDSGTKHTDAAGGGSQRCRDRCGSLSRFKTQRSRPVCGNHRIHRQVTIGHCDRDIPVSSECSHPRADDRKAVGFIDRNVIEDSIGRCQTADIRHQNNARGGRQRRVSRGLQTCHACIGDAARVGEVNVCRHHNVAARAGQRAENHIAVRNVADQAGRCCCAGAGLHFDGCVCTPCRNHVDCSHTSGRNGPGQILIHSATRKGNGPCRRTDGGIQRQNSAARKIHGPCPVCGHQTVDCQGCGSHLNFDIPIATQRANTRAINDQRILRLQPDVSTRLIGGTQRLHLNVHVCNAGS